MKRWVKWLFLVFAGLLIVCGIGIAYYTYGLTWSIDSDMYGRMFHAMPEPPGYLPRTDFVSLTPYNRSFRSYHVEMDYAETVNFFVTEFPGSGWNLVTKKEGGVGDVSRVTPGEYLKDTTMLFVNHQWCWLSVSVSVKVDKEGRQIDPFPFVIMEISTDGVSSP